VASTTASTAFSPPTTSRPKQTLEKYRLCIGYAFSVVFFQVCPEMATTEERSSNRPHYNSSFFFFASLLFFFFFASGVLPFSFLRLAFSILSFFAFPLSGSFDGAMSCSF